MKFSREWLQSYIKELLPSREIIDDVLSRKAFEVEGIETVDDDEIYDIKVLPNRHGDALSHYFMAGELCALFGFARVPISVASRIYGDTIHGEKSQMTVEDEKSCTVFLSVSIDGVDTRPSPEWMRRRLESIGQRSINAIVDITNYVQFAINKPMHSYDTRDVTGEFVVRFATNAEPFIALNSTELKLDTETLVISDQADKVLGLAGIKGGMYSGIKDDTTSIRLESANFDPVLIRKTAKKYNLHTDASKRFEAGQSDTLTVLGMDLAISLYREIFGEQIKVTRDVGSFSLVTESPERNIIIDKVEINAALGSDYDSDLIEKTLHDLDFSFIKNEDTYNISVPTERVDLKIKVDIIEEIGRVIGYDTLKPVLPEIKDEHGIGRKGKYNSQMNLEMALRYVLCAHGYDELITYTLSDKGQVYLENSVGDKVLRDNISDGLIKSFYKNLNNAPLMGIEVIRSYEIGSVFTAVGEYRHIAIVCDDNKKKSNFQNEIETLIKDIESELFSKTDEKIKINFVVKSEKPYAVEIDLNVLVGHGGLVYLDIDHDTDWKYKHLSPYPIVTRDVSCFYPADLSTEKILALIKDVTGGVRNVTDGTSAELVKNLYLVDSFEKELDDGTMKRSVAFRIVYQAEDRTLTDNEINVEVDRVYEALRDAGCELR